MARIPSVADGLLARLRDPVTCGQGDARELPDRPARLHDLWSLQL